MNRRHHGSILLFQSEDSEILSFEAFSKNCDSSLPVYCFGLPMIAAFTKSGSVHERPFFFMWKQNSGRVFKFVNSTLKKHPWQQPAPVALV
jgi:hypothetical protein